MPFSSQRRGMCARISSGWTSSAMTTNCASPRSTSFVTSFVPLRIFPLSFASSIAWYVLSTSSFGISKRTYIGLAITETSFRHPRTGASSVIGPLVPRRAGAEREGVIKGLRRGAPLLLRRPARAPDQRAEDRESDDERHGDPRPRRPGLRPHGPVVRPVRGLRGRRERDDPRGARLPAGVHGDDPGAVRRQWPEGDAEARRRAALEPVRYVQAGGRDPDLEVVDVLLPR